MNINGCWNLDDDDADDDDDDDDLVCFQMFLQTYLVNLKPVVQFIPLDLEHMLTV